MKSKHWKISLSDIDISQREIHSIQSVLRSKWLSMGEKTLEFEDRFKKLHGVKYAFAVTNCTCALHLANLAIGLTIGDEVICPSFTFVATVNSILYAGAKPVLADIASTNDLNISLNDIERKISEKTKAIIVVHYAGYPCDMTRIMKLARKYNLYVIEDCAHAPLVKHKNKFLGTFGDLGCFSFFANKNITTAEGGMVTTNNEKFALKIKNMRSHGMTSLTLDRYKGHSSNYDVVNLGFNFRIDEIRAALGLAQLERLARFNEKRRCLVNYYRKGISNIPQVELVFKGFNLKNCSCHIFPILLKKSQDRAPLRDFLKRSGIQTSQHYQPVHMFSYYRKKFKRASLPITENVASRILTLPLYPGLRKEQIDYIVKSIRDYFRSH